MPMLFKSCCMVSLSSSFVVFQAFSLSCLCTACLGSLLSSIRRTCPSHLSLLSFMIRPIFSMPCPLVTDCLSMRCPSFFFGTYGVIAVCFVQLLVATSLHRITSWTSLTTHTISLRVWCWYVCSSTLISIFEIRCWLCRLLFGSLCRSYTVTCHIATQQNSSVISTAAFPMSTLCIP